MSLDAGKSSGAGLDDIVVCPSGSLAHVYLTAEVGRVTRERIDALRPGFLAALADHPGVGLVMVRSETAGLVLLQRSRVCRLEGDDSAARDEMLRDFGAHAVPSLLRLGGFANCGDIVLLGPIDGRTGDVTSYEELVGSHGGLGGWQTEGFLLHPSDLNEDEGPLVGAPALYRQCRRWMGEVPVAG